MDKGTYNLQDFIQKEREICVQEVGFHPFTSFNPFTNVKLWASQTDSGRGSWNPSGIQLSDIHQLGIGDMYGVGTWAGM